MTIQLDYFYRTDEKPDIGKFRFFRVPKLLFAIERYLRACLVSRCYPAAHGLRNIFSPIRHCFSLKCTLNYFYKKAVFNEKSPHSPRILRY